jgi:Tfp pilus assembly protein PilX
MDKKQSGFLVMVVVVLLVIVAALATTFVAIHVSGSNASSSTVSANNAYDLAQAGIENGSYQLTTGTCNVAWSASVTVTGSGEYQYNCTQYTATTTITSALTATATMIPLNSVTGFASFGSVNIDSETIYYDGISGSSLINAQRGQNGTTAVVHSLGASANHAQYIIGGKGGAPSLTSSAGMVTLYQAALTTATNIYYAVGARSSGSKVGSILSFDGTVWTVMLTNSSSFVFNGVDTSATYGLAVGSTTSNVGSIYQFNGTSWSVLTSSVSNTLFNAVSCDYPNNPTDCWVVGQASAPQPYPLMYHNGTTYTSTTVGNFLVGAVSCISGRCLATGMNDVYNFLISSVAPFTSRYNTGGSLNGISCPQTNSCLSVRSNGNVDYYNGATVVSFNITNRTLRGVHCPTNTNCFVVGNNGFIANCTLPVTSIASCTRQTTPGSISLQAVHCNTASSCLAVSLGSNINAYYYTGGVWINVRLPTNYDLNSVSGIPGGEVVVTPTVFHNQ